MIRAPEQSDAKDLIYEGIATAPPTYVNMPARSGDAKDLIYEGIATLRKPI